MTESSHAPRRARRAGTPLVIGLTGGIASGKSAVSARLAAKGAHVIDADRVGHRVIAPEGPAYRPVIEAFGREIVAPDGTIDRRRLGAIVFAAPARLKQLEAISHPRMVEMVRQEIAEIRARPVPARPPLILLDAAILFEAGWDVLCDAVWVVLTDAETAIARVMARNGLTREQALARQQAQLSNEARAARADLVIRNEGTLEALHEAVDALYAETVNPSRPEGRHAADAR
ncbi:MAG: dephospho-CoA kinase [Candidatus Lambdaproteobacteria bacterium]|nr:dephospho-CoA kinase [Candidatus Lambdaproteobacteria bacterium]